MKLNKHISDALGKIPKIKSFKSKKASEETAIPKRTRHKKSWRARVVSSKLERTPASDTVEIKGKEVKPAEKKKRTPVSKTNIGDIFTAGKRELARAYLSDLDDVAQAVPGATFIREVNSETSVKKITSIIGKLAKREDKYNERGYKEVIRDEIRARMFMLDADQNYQKIIDEMAKKKYKVATTFEEDAKGNLIFDSNNNPIKIPDVDVRFGDKAQASGYQDVQIRFEKGGMLYELIIMPGPNYMFAANKEHAIYDQFKRYDSLGLTRDVGAKQIVNALKQEVGKVTRKLYDAAEMRDRYGSAAAQDPVSFSPDEIKTINGLLSSLKKLFLGKFNTLSPSKKTVPEFKDTKNALNLSDIEQNLRMLLEPFKPKEPPKAPEV